MQDTFGSFSFGTVSSLQKGETEVESSIIDSICSTVDLDRGFKLDISNSMVQVCQNYMCLRLKCSPTGNLVSARAALNVSVLAR